MIKNSLQEEKDQQAKENLQKVKNQQVKVKILQVKNLYNVELSLKKSTKTNLEHLTAILNVALMVRKKKKISTLKKKNKKEFH